MAVVNRFSQRQKYATFNPMTMQELMVVPQFRQQQHDQAVAQAEALKTQENVIGVDQEQFDMQAGEINKGISTIVDDLSEKGLQTNTLGSVRSLKNKRDTFLGAEGFGGKAMSNYALYQKALGDIDEMRKSGDYLNKDINESFALAMKNYNDLGGAAAGGSFAYQSPEQYIDVQTKLNDLLKDVPISEQERDLGLTPMGPNKYGQMVYKHGSEIIEARSYEHQRLLAKKYLANDPEVMNYMKMQANFAENLHAVKENGTNKIIYDDGTGAKTYDADTFQTDFIMSKIENFSRIGAEATDVYNVKTKLDYDIRNLSDAWLKAEEAANQRGNLAVYGGPMTENTLLGDPGFDQSELEQIRTTGIKFVKFDEGVEKEGEYISKGEGYIPAGLSLSGYKEFLKENHGYESPSMLETFTNFANYKLAGSKFKVSHVTRLQFPEDTPKNVDLKIDYDPQYEDPTYVELPDIPQNAEDFYVKWQEMKDEISTIEGEGKNFANLPEDQIKKLYNYRTQGKNSGISKEEVFAGIEDIKSINNVFIKMNMKAVPKSKEEMDAERWIHNTYINNAFDAYRKMNPNADFETFKEDHTKNLKNAAQTEVLTTTVEGTEPMNNYINDFWKDQNVGGLQDIVFTAWDESDGERKVKKTKGKNTLEGNDKAEFLKELQTGKFTVTNPQRNLYTGNPNEVGGYSMVVNLTDKDGKNPKTYKIRTYALSKGDQRRYQGMAMANREWLTDNKVTTPSAVSKENVVAYDESVITTVKDGRYFDQYNREMIELGAAVETGLADGSGLEPNTRIISRYSAFNTYMPGANGIVNQGMRRLYKVKTDASGREVEVPLIDPDKYDEAIYNMDTENPAQNFIRGQMMFSTQGMIKRIRDIDEIYQYEAMRYPSSSQRGKLEPGR